MKFKEFGDIKNPTILWLHGGGLSWWSLTQFIDAFKDHYHVVTPIIDGHGEDWESTFVSIEASAAKVLAYIDAYCEGKVYAVGGLSLGAQIVVEMLSQRAEIANYAIVESALVHPLKGAGLLAAPMVSLTYGLIKQRWFAQLQAKALFLPSELFEVYYADSSKMSKESLINITISNGSYTLKRSLSETTARVFVLVGEKELKMMTKSALTLSTSMPRCKLEVLINMGHGELGMTDPKAYIQLIDSFLNKKDV